MEINKFIEKVDKYVNEKKAWLGPELKKEWSPVDEHGKVIPFCARPEAGLPNKIPESIISFKNILLVGETGVGKELAAHAIAKKIEDIKDEGLLPKNKMNCAAMVPTIIQSELFGNIKNVGTCVTERYSVLSDIRKEGDPVPVVFLDELHRLPLEGQATLLRAIETNEVCRVGEKPQKTVFPKIIGTAQPEALKNNEIIIDLRERFQYEYYIQPIRKTILLIPGLVTIFLYSAFKKREELMMKRNPEYKDKISKLFLSDLKKIKVSKKTIWELAACRWLGNIRQLKNTVQNFEINKETGEITFSIPGKYSMNIDEWKGYRYVYREMFGTGYQVPLEKANLWRLKQKSGLLNPSFVSIKEYEESGLSRIEEVPPLTTYKEEKKAKGYLTLPELFDYIIPIRNYEMGADGFYQIWDQYIAALDHRQEVMSAAWDSARKKVYETAAKKVIEEPLKAKPVLQLTDDEIKQIVDKKDKKAIINFIKKAVTENLTKEVAVLSIKRSVKWLDKEMAIKKISWNKIKNKKGK